MTWPCPSVSLTRLLHLEEVQAAHPRGRLAVALVDLARLGVLDDHGARPDHTIRGDLYIVADGAVHAEEAVLAHLAVAGDHHVRRNEAVVADHRAVADVVAAPQDHVVADHRMMLEDIVLENETVLADAHVVPHEGPGADVRNRRIPLRLGRL